VVAACVVSAPLAGAARSKPEPLAISAASLTQNARELVWSVQLARPFSPAALAHSGRSLCLLIERRSSGAVSGRLCVGAARGGGRPALAYARVTASGPGRPRTIAATITRAGSRSLTASFLPSSVGIGYSSIRWQVISTLGPPACTPPQPDRVGCLTLFPRHPALASLHTPQVAGCVPSGPAFVNSGPSNRRVIALTFDDGPWTMTTQFLSLLEREHVPATFMEIGRQISTYGHGGAIERRMLADGDMIGDHTWDHANVSGAGSFAAREISMTADALRGATGGFTPCLFRAPGGAVSGALISQARAMGFTTIQWDVDPQDWRRPGTDAIYANVVGHAHPGAIVLQHDGGGDRSETLAALPREIATLRSRGYRFETVTALLGQRLIYR
jgi:peptidoglycan/xylan/chitin deacetylase (PgdA/CDA1 family)